MLRNFLPNILWHYVSYALLLVTVQFYSNIRFHFFVKSPSFNICHNRVTDNKCSFSVTAAIFTLWHMICNIYIRWYKYYGGKGRALCWFSSSCNGLLPPLNAPLLPIYIKVYIKVCSTIHQSELPPSLGCPFLCRSM